jgi:hypothetical protein
LEKFNPSPTKNEKNQSADSSDNSINSSKYNDSRKSLKSKASPGLKHPPPMIEGIDLTTSENAKQLNNMTNASTAPRIFLKVSDSCVSLVEWILVMWLHQLLLVKVL